MKNVMFIDTHKVFVRLTESGFDEKQANAILDTLSANNEQLATKADINNVISKMNELKVEIMYKVVPIIVASIAIVQTVIAYASKS